VKKKRPRTKKGGVQKQKPQQEQVPETPKQPKHRRLLHTAELVLGTPAAALGLIYMFWGPFWPIAPEFSPGAPSFGSSFDVSFSGANKSGLFSNSNLVIRCKIICIQSASPDGSRVSGRDSFVAAQGPNRLTPGATGQFICPMRGRVGVGRFDAVDVVTNAQIAFESEYDNPFSLWLSRKAASSGAFSLNTRAVPPQWVQGDLPGSCVS
jgi:hypothetical protein